MKVMVLKYIKLWLSFYNNSLTRDMEFKANFLGGLFIDFIYYSINFFFFTIIYSYVDSLGVFTREDVMVFLVITFLIDTVYMFLFSGNLFNMNRLMVRGDLDYFLLKPINSQFMISFRYIRSYALLIFAAMTSSPRIGIQGHVQGLSTPSNKLTLTPHKPETRTPEDLPS